MRYRTYQLVGIFILLIGLILVLSASGQYREYYLYGKVLDTQKNPLEGVEIALRDVVTNRSYSIKTKTGGEFKFAGLPHGIYKVIFIKEGYAAKEDEWKFEIPQNKMQKVEIPAVVLLSQAQIKEADRFKEMQGADKEVAEKIKQKDFDGAISLSQKLLEKDPKDANVLYFLGMSYARIKSYAQAVDSLIRVTQLSPNFPPAYFELGVCYQQQNNLNLALEYYQKNLDLDSANVDSAYNSGLILFGLNRIDEALAKFDKALSLKPDDPAFLEMAGRCHINKANYEKAVEYLEKAKSGYNDPEKIKFLDDLVAKLREQIRK